MFEKIVKIRNARKILQLDLSQRRSYVGKIGEQLVADIYSSQGYVVVGRNAHTGKYGELDVVAIKDKNICFIEVKTRLSEKFGNAIESISVVKQFRLQNAIHQYLRSHPKYESYVPFLHFAALSVNLDKSHVSVTIVDN